ncbi:TnsA-like heteromeric transposase endonuclease subunit [Brevibacterium casei]|uniref:TnsA-like heteromeric transposase endonuclease subunit n=1 Tax=Brevibacterium casei TaxID=33889 RepID=UPI00119D8982
MLLRRYDTTEGSSVTTTVGVVDTTRLSKGLPVRSLRSYVRQRHYPGLFWSATTGGHVPYESRLELDRLWVADFDPRVVWISGQPMWLSDRDGAAVRRHGHDFLLTGSDSRLTVADVEPAEFVSWPKVASLFTWTRQVCEAADWRYEMWCGDGPDREAIQSVQQIAIPLSGSWDTGWVHGAVAALGGASDELIPATGKLGRFLRPSSPRAGLAGELEAELADRLPVNLRAQFGYSVC